MSTYAAQLASVQEAIVAIETAIATGQGAQEVRFSDGRMVRSYSPADLPALYAREATLRALAAREAAGGGITVRIGVGA